MSASTKKVAIYFAVCDGSTASDTVKIKKIYEDGTGITTVGDTTIAHCGGTATTFLSGLAVSGDYAYFSWLKEDGSSAALGRIKKDGSSSAEVNYISAPVGVGYLQISANPLDGNLFALMASGSFKAGLTDYRISKISISESAIQTCHTPSNTSVMAFGVGRDAIYFSVQTPTRPDTELTTIYRLPSNCSSPTLAADLMDDLKGVGAFHTMDSGSPNASLITETDSEILVSTVKNQTVQGLSKFKKGETLTEFQEHVVKLDNEFVGRAVWGFNYLYFKNDQGANTMYRTKIGGQPEQVFAEHIKGILHHISIVEETVVATVPAPKSLEVSKRGITAKQFAKELGIKIPKNSKVKFTIAKRSVKNCEIKKSRVVSKRAGTCRITMTITTNKGKVIKRTKTLTTS